MIRILLYFVFIHLFYSCKAQKTLHDDYSKQVGEIPFDDQKDDFAFKLSDSLILFFEPVIDGEKPTIIKHFKEHYSEKGFEEENGYLTIRFFVNKNGKTGKFRSEEMDFNYKKIQMNDRLCTQILKLTRELKGWQALQINSVMLGYYTYLNFKIVRGEIKEITP